MHQQSYLFRRISGSAPGAVSCQWWYAGAPRQSRCGGNFVRREEVGHPSGRETTGHQNENGFKGFRAKLDTKINDRLLNVLNGFGIHKELVQGERLSSPGPSEK